MLISQLLPHSITRHDFIRYISNNNKVYISFFKHLYSLTLNREKSEQNLYHRIDKKILSQIDENDLILKMSEYITNIKEKFPFNNYIHKIFD